MACRFWPGACLERCYGSGEVLPRVAAFVSDLEKVDAWNPDEIRAVDRGVRHMLHEIITPPLPAIEKSHYTSLVNDPRSV